jgi:hypothetical protein
LITGKRNGAIITGRRARKQMVNSRYNRCLQIALAVLLVAIPVLTGCNIFYTKTVTIDEGIAHFSFARPEGYTLKTRTIEDSAEVKYTYIVLSGPVGESLINSVIGIQVIYPSPDFPDSLALWEYNMSTYEEYDDFETIDCSPATVGGIQGSECGCYYTETADLGRNLPDVVPVKMICKGVYFEYNGLIWGITLLSALDDMDENRAHFDYLLESFTFLD